MRYGRYEHKAPLNKYKSITCKLLFILGRNKVESLLINYLPIHFIINQENQKIIVYLNILFDVRNDFESLSKGIRTAFERG